MNPLINTLAQADPIFDGMMDRLLCNLVEPILEKRFRPSEWSKLGGNWRLRLHRDFHQLSPKEVSDGVMRELAASDRGTEAGDGE